jgi:hypothetical protein
MDDYGEIVGFGGSSAWPLWSLWPAKSGWPWIHGIPCPATAAPPRTITAKTWVATGDGEAPARANDGLPSPGAGDPRVRARGWPSLLQPRPDCRGPALLARGEPRVHRAGDGTADRLPADRNRAHDSHLVKQACRRRCQPASRPSCRTVCGHRPDRLRPRHFLGSARRSCRGE